MEEYLAIQNIQRVAVFKDYKIYACFNDFIKNKNLNFLKANDLLNEKKQYNDFNNFTRNNMYFEIWIKKYSQINPSNESDKIIGRSTSVSSDKKWYFLNETNGLYTELAKVNPFSEQELMKFVKIFGLQIGPNCIELGTEYVDSATPLMIQYVNLSTLQNAILYYRSLFDIFKNIVTKNINSIIERDELFGKNSEQNFYYDKNDSEEVLDTEIDFFYNEINKHNILNLYLTRDFSMKGKSRTLLYHDNIIDYAIFQMYKALNNNNKFKTCKNCGNIFEVTHEKMKFCPPLPFRKRSSCEMAFSNKTRRS